MQRQLALYIQKMLFYYLKMTWKTHINHTVAIMCLLVSVFTFLFIQLSTFTWDRYRTFCARMKHESSWPHHCLYSMFSGNICVHSHVIESVTHMLDCHDLASAGHYWMMCIRAEYRVIKYTPYLRVPNTIPLVIIYLSINVIFKHYSFLFIWTIDISIKNHYF